MIVKNDITTTLSLNTQSATSYAYMSSTSAQTYYWTSPCWRDVVGEHVRRKWLVKHEFRSSGLPSQTIPTTAFNAITAPAGYGSLPFCPTILIGTNLNCASYCPGLVNVINAISFDLDANVAIGSNQVFPCLTHAAPRYFIVDTPENANFISITTQPVSSTTVPGTTTPAIQPYPNDFYTEGIHVFTFTLVSE